MAKKALRTIKKADSFLDRTWDTTIGTKGIAGNLKAATSGNYLDISNLGTSQAEQEAEQLRKEQQILEEEAQVEIDRETAIAKKAKDKAKKDKEDAAITQNRIFNARRRGLVGRRSLISGTETGDTT
tara:strand:- start:846 stop:1226 length:381 start_codon:yes stop_codon:yes gene_type:complete